MQKIVSVFILVLLVTGCRKSSGKPGMLEGRVVRVSCASFVVEVLNNKNIGEDKWLDVTTNKHHNNAIAADNQCEIADLYPEGKKIRFNIDTARFFGGCVTCDMYDAPPKIAYILKDISIIP